MTRSPTIAVVTVASGRRDHLALQARSLADQDVPPDRYVLVDLGGPDPEASFAGGLSPIVITDHVVGELPLARARNRGAAVADADITIFLDVDCLAQRSLVRHYRDACFRRPGVHAGPVGYLPHDAPSTLDVERLEAVARYQPGRPTPSTPMHRTPRLELFWSLSFAVDRSSWQRIGGFDERYVGYGGEDTDLARRADASGVPIWFSGLPRAYHQWHPVESPPIRHLEAICRNATLFHRIWNVWPMVGWLEQFAAAGLVDWHPNGDVCATRTLPDR